MEVWKEITLKDNLSTFYRIKVGEYFIMLEPKDGNLSFRLIDQETVHRMDSRQEYGKMNPTRLTNKKEAHKIAKKFGGEVVEVGEYHVHTLTYRKGDDENE